MADIQKLKKKAADFEAKKQMDKALLAYRQMIEVYESGSEHPIDVPLYNRVGDLLHASGSLPEAVSVWERAVDHYTDGGFYNLAIALCNKILRQSPGRAVVYYKLGKISAEKGFKADARENFLEYAGRMQKSGNLDEAFRALKEFADLVPDQDDVRIMLADQLLKAGRKDEAVEQLQITYVQLTRQDRPSDAEAVAEKLKAIDPAIEPRADEGGGAARGGGLVFLDLEPSGGPGGRRSRISRSGLTPIAEAKRVTKATEGLEILDMGMDLPTVAPAAAKQRQVPDAPAAPVVEPPHPASEGLVIERTLGEDTPPPPRESVLGLVSTSLTEEPPPIDLPLIELDSAPAADPIEPPLPETAERRMPPARRSTNATPLPETAERRVRLIETDEAQSSTDAPLTTVRLSDFGTFGVAAGTTPPSTQAQDPNSLEIISSEDAGILPFGDTLPDPSLVESTARSLFGFVEDRTTPAEGTEPPVPRATTSSVVLASSVDMLRERAASTPEDWGLRRQLAEALLDDGQREGGIEELEVALAGYERDGDLDTAASIAEEIVRLAPKVIRYHQKRVEFAFRAADRRRLAEAYVELADALLGDGQSAKARVVYRRVLEISPDDLRAQAALETIADVPVPEPTPAPRRSTHAVRPSVGAKPKAKSAKPDAEEFISLGDWLREEEEPKSTRMVVEEKEPTGDEQADFADMLRKFKQGVSDNVDDEDHEAHYDLGVAYKEMGLLDEAIGEFQKSLRGTSNRVRALEALGLCFVEKLQLPVAATILQRALLEPGISDESLVGVLYLLGTISEELHLFPDAKRYYQRVFAVDIQFRDIGVRLNEVERQLK